MLSGGRRGAKCRRMCTSPGCKPAKPSVARRIYSDEPPRNSGMSATAAALPARTDELFGHPKGLYVCFFKIVPAWLLREMAIEADQISDRIAAAR